MSGFRVNVGTGRINWNLPGVEGEGKMDTKIFYFSGTGNSLFAAKQLAEKIPDAELVPIVQAYGIGQTVAVSSEAVGFVFPMHAFSLPEIVRLFLESVSLPENAYLFAVCTRGGACAPVFEQMDQILAQKELKLNSRFFIEMPNNYLTMFPVPSENEIRKLTEDAETVIASIAAAVADRKSVPLSDPHYSFFEKNVLFPILGKVFRKTRYFGVQNKFYADEKCCHCGRCAEVCLSGKITMRGSAPYWKKDVPCYYCFACIHFCPTHAIQIKGTKTPEKSRYHHPSIDAADIAAQKQERNAT